MADVNEFPGEGSAEPLKYWEDYDTSGATARSAKKLPPKGLYAFNSSPPPVEFAEQNEGHLQARIDPTIVGGDFNGHTFNYVRVTTRQYKGRRASQFGDYLYASGFQGKIGGTPEQVKEQLKAAATAVAGRGFSAELNYSIYCKGCKTRLADNYEALPTNKDGEKVGYTKCPTCKVVDDEGKEQPKTVFAEPRFFFVIPKKA
jgi:hypothetical protein